MASSLGTFQWDNLVRNRVSFVFINFGVDTTAVYPHIFKMHLERLTLPWPQGDIAQATSADIVDAVKAQPKDAPIVVLDHDGKKSEAVAEALEAAGFINVLFVRGGWNLFLQEQKDLLN